MSRKAWPVPKLWDGEPVVIIGSGPSLTLAQLRHVALARLENRCRVAVVNDAVFVAWWADWLHGCDSKWWLWHRDRATKFPGIRTTCTETVSEAWAEYIAVLPPENGDGARPAGWRGGFAEDPDMVAGGGNGVYQMMQLAAKAGGGDQILLGVDMQPGGDGRAHWFGDHPDGMRSDYKSTMIDYFPSLIVPLADRGIAVTNCSPGSALTCFSQARLEEVL